MSLFFETSLNLPVKTYDIDFAGVVSNVVYVRWLEDLRIAMLTNYFPLKSQIEEGFAPAILHTEISYKKSIKLLDLVYGRVWIDKLTKLRWYVGFEIYSNDAISATAEQIGIFINLSEQRPIRIPNSLLQMYINFQR